MAVFLYRVGHGVGVRQTSVQLDISLGAVVYITMWVAKLVMEVLATKYVQWPSPEEQELMSEDWQREKDLR